MTEMTGDGTITATTMGRTSRGVIGIIMVMMMILPMVWREESWAHQWQVLYELHTSQVAADFVLGCHGSRIDIGISIMISIRIIRIRRRK
jgi:hypothetical protein